MPLTQSELTAVADMLKLEHQLILQCKDCTINSKDNELKKACEKLAAQHQNHYNSLLTLVE